MYTQCPQCDAVYRVTSAHLSVAGGEVQCGGCGARFDALDRLSDTYPDHSDRSAEGSGEAAAFPPPADAEPSDEAAGPAPGGGDDGAPEVEPTAEEETPEAGADTGSGDDEGEGPEREPESEREIEADSETESEAETETEPETEFDVVAELETEDEDTAEDEAEDEEFRWQLADLVDDGETAEARGEPEGDEGEAPLSAAAAAALRGADDEPTINLDTTAEALFEAAELEEQELPQLDSLELVEGLPSGETPHPEAVEAEPPAEVIPRRPAAAWKWMRRILILLVLLSLGAAAVHSQRGTLMRNSAVAPVLERIYGRIGLSVEPTWDIGSYRILESAAEIDDAGQLQVTLRFANEASYPQPYPVLRVSLEDRWGDEIGSRVLPPADYLSGFVAGRMLGPDRRTQGQATLEAPDAAAVGFRLDLCFADAGDALSCLSDQP